MRVLVYGAGIQGSLLAHVLATGGNDVTVLARGKRAEELRSNGIVIRHYIQRKTTVDKIKVIHELNKDDVYDVIFITMKYTDFPHVLPALAQNSSENIILVGNNATASEMEAYIEANSEKAKNIAFGFQLSGGIKEENRIIALRFNAGEMVIGGLEKEVNFKDVLEQIFKNTKYKITYEKNIDDWLKSHIILILPMNLAAHIKDNNLKAVARDHGMLRQLVAAMDEGYDVLKDLGYEIIPAQHAHFVKRYKLLNFLFYKLYHCLPIASKVEGSFAELKGLYDVFYKMKAESKVITPNLDSLVHESEAKIR
ncbi:ketopantoate reductase family protein [Paenibacillus fonticola]|uniref:ketopantoate reductase family protein n=1 Tax=Paenibacillus fonticola TaxID=379896 RepID=UPI000376C56A|nr:2-dehydropantoate 2-reductase N-terminal domain-containing protein [Paenibacillus fonticola]